MNSIFSQINRFNGVTFAEGEHFEFTLPAKQEKLAEERQQALTVGGTYKIFVKQYMTKPADNTFDFQEKWNNNVPMPLCVMTGTVLKETRGMVQMELHAEIEATHRCMVCGKPLTNKISQLYGIGPECGKHFYINPFDTEEELDEAVEELRNKVREIKWTGWVIKSAIKEWGAI